jgi:hypothetical protein
LSQWWKANTLDFWALNILLLKNIKNISLRKNRKFFNTIL